MKYSFLKSNLTRPSSAQNDSSSATTDHAGLGNELNRIRQIFTEPAVQPEPMPVFKQEQMVRFQQAQLTGSIAHELRSPLTSIRASAFMMQRKADKAGLDLSSAYQRIDNSLQRCNDVITELLDKSWADELQRLELPFDEWLSKLIRNFAAQALEGIEVNCDPAFGDDMTAFDPVRLESAYVLILTNAANAVRQPGQAVSRISISSRKTHRGIEVTLANSGPHIAQNKLNDIRKPWMSTELFATGTGLAFSKYVFEKHLGGLEVENLEPHGVSFTTWIAVKA